MLEGNRTLNHVRQDKVISHKLELVDIHIHGENIETLEINNFGGSNYIVHKNNSKY